MTAGNDGDAAGLHLIQSICGSVMAHVPAKWIRFADKDMRQHKNLRRNMPAIVSAPSIKCTVMPPAGSKRAPSPPTRE
jgi:hypothetical protein